MKKEHITCPPIAKPWWWTSQMCRHETRICNSDWNMYADLKCNIHFETNIWADVYESLLCSCGRCWRTIALDALNRVACKTHEKRTNIVIQVQRNLDQYFMKSTGYLLCSHTCIHDFHLGYKCMMNTNAHVHQTIWIIYIYICFIKLHRAFRQSCMTM